MMEAAARGRPPAPTVAFLGHYLKGRPLRALDKAAQRLGLTRLTADP
jgi:hypothetical protein